MQTNEEVKNKENGGGKISNLSDCCTFEEFFDPYNVEHLIAFKYLNKNGYWPEGFIPEIIKMGDNWQMIMFSKMAMALVDLRIDGKI